MLLYWAGHGRQRLGRPASWTPWNGRSGRSPAAGSRPAAALGLAAGLTAAGLGPGRRSRAVAAPLAVAVPLAATVWAYDLRGKNTAAGPAVMAACRGLDVLLGAGGRARAGRCRRR